MRGIHDLRVEFDRDGFCPACGRLATEHEPATDVDNPLPTYECPEMPEDTILVVNPHVEGR